MNTKSLWKQRRLRFLKEIAPYVLYSLRSGLAALIIILMFVAMFFYGRLLEDMPSDFPAIPVVVALVGVIVVYSPVRTYIREADTLFLLPAESPMKQYFRTATLNAAIGQSIAVVVAWLVLWPLYQAAGKSQSITMTLGEGPWPFIVGLVLLLAMKWWSLYNSWREMQLRERSHRRLFILIRAAATFFLLYAAASYPLLRFLPLLLAATVLYTIALRLPPDLPTHWLHLAEREQRTIRRTYRFLGWFVDVPDFLGQPSRRRALDALVRRIRHQSANTFTFLYSVIFFRSDLFGVKVRLTILGGLFIGTLSQDWAKLTAYSLSVWITALQLSALDQAYRHTDWLHIYPLPEALRGKSAAKVRYKAHTYAILVFAIIALSTMDFWMAIASLAGGLTFSAWYHLLRKNA